jgi:hypothetical protein
MGKHLGKCILERARKEWEENIFNIMRETGRWMEGSCPMMPASTTTVLLVSII